MIAACQAAVETVLAEGAGLASETASAGDSLATETDGFNMRGE
jgi:hypothetical protein